MDRSAPDDGSEEGLIDEARSGSRRAFETLSERHRRELLRHAASRMGAELRARLEPEDVVQDTLLKAYGGLDRFRWKGPGSFGRWLRGIAEHLIRNAARKGAAAARGEALRSFSLEPVSTDPSPSRRARREERFERLREALRGLGPDHREVIELARIQGLRIREIAARMGRSEDAVKQLLARALKSLRNRFGDTASLGLPERALGPRSAERAGSGGAPEEEAS